MKIPRYILVLVAVLVFALMVTCLMYVWFPEMVSTDVFVRLLISFCVLLLGSAALAVLGRILSGDKSDQ
jgi:hypothetical protein